MSLLHQYIERASKAVKTETFFGDRMIRFLYSRALENAPSLYNLISAKRTSRLLAYLNYDFPFRTPENAGLKNIDLRECAEPHSTNGARAFFERKIRYWECRPLGGSLHSVLSPADSKVLNGSLKEHSLLYIKEKFFSIEELLGAEKSSWIHAFTDGDFAIFRLTPEKYHYNHTPVAGEVVDFYKIAGRCHSCNPYALMALPSPYCKNERFVTVIDTDIPGGTGVGLVAMIEVVALMIGNIVQCYSEERYDSPQPIEIGMFLRKGQPKSLYRPGSSTDILLFQKDRVEFCTDLIENLHRRGVQTRFSSGLHGRPLVETEVMVRSEIACALQSANYRNLNGRQME